MKKKPLTLENYVAGIKQSDRVVLSRAITLVESNNPNDKILANKLISECLPFSGNSIRIGVTGIPGVGKSTFIEAFGSYLISIGKKVAVLAIDPSSATNKGSILGDKTRMEKLAANEKAYIRPSASGGTLGGVTKSTREAVIICETAGYDVVVIETVGVGQSETIVHSMTDFFLLLTLSGTGDELQGMKRGIMEIADAIIINKVEDESREKAMLLKNQLQNALHLFPVMPNGWSPKLSMCSSLENTGIEKIWQIVEQFQVLTKENNSFTEKRHKQDITCFRQTLENSVRDLLFQNPDLAEMILKVEKSVNNGLISPYLGVEKVSEYIKQVLTPFNH